MSSNDAKISLVGSIALGTGVMIGAGIFALVGQVAALAGPWFPLAFAAGAVVALTSSHVYARYSSVNPSAGGIAMLLKDAYGPRTIAGTFSMFMYVSMVIAESLLARTFGTYLLTPFGMQDSLVLVPILGVILIVIAALVNLVGNRAVEASALITAALKIIGIAILAVAGLIATTLTNGWASLSEGNHAAQPLDAIGSVALCILAYKGFTTITNQGEDLRHPERNIARSIYLSIVICAVLYLLLNIAVSASLGADGAAEARDYALAEAARPIFGHWGVTLTVVIAIIATVSGLLASLYSVSRLYAMLQEMHQVPRLPASIPQQPLLVTAAAAIVLTATLDLSQIASVGVFLYLSMDIAAQWGVLRRLKSQVPTKRWLPAATILLDAVLLVTFLIAKARADVLAVVIAAAIAVAIFLAQFLAVRRRNDADRSETGGSQ